MRILKLLKIRMNKSSLYFIEDLRNIRLLFRNLARKTQNLDYRGENLCVCECVSYILHNTKRKHARRKVLAGLQGPFLSLKSRRANFSHLVNSCRDGARDEEKKKKSRIVWLLAGVFGLIEKLRMPCARRGATLRYCHCSRSASCNR